jgi:hypothetical protein
LKQREYFLEFKILSIFPVFKAGIRYDWGLKKEESKNRGRKNKIKN